MGSIIYRPKGRAAEYAPWAANIFVGCSNDCEYCYCKKGVLGHGMGQKTPQLKKPFQLTHKQVLFSKDCEAARKLAFITGCAKAADVFDKELERYRDKIMAAGKGIFFTFSSDPCLLEPVNTFHTFMRCALMAIGIDSDDVPPDYMPPIPVTLLTKRADWIDTEDGQRLLKAGGKYLCVGFTLTGRDDLEPNASPNMERVEAMRRIHDMGVHTFASIEPVIDLDCSLDMIKATLGFCDEYKIGLESGAKHNKKPITLEGVVQFVEDVQKVVAEKAPQAKIYWKDSITKKVDGLVKYSEQVVDAGYNIFAEGVK